jgi:hypothetical protein
MISSFFPLCLGSSSSGIFGSLISSLLSCFFSSFYFGIAAGVAACYVLYFLDLSFFEAGYLLKLYFFSKFLTQG